MATVGCTTKIAKISGNSALTTDLPLQDFGDLTIHTLSATKTISFANETISGRGAGTLTCTAPVLSNSVDFILGAHTCGTIAAGKSCTVIVSTQPTTQGVIESDLELTCTDTSGTSHTVTDTLRVNSVEIILAVNPLTQGFGSVNVGSNSASTVFTFSNTGNESATGCSAPTITDTTNFTLTSDTCGTADLSSSGSCTVSIRANPATTGAHTTTLSRTCVAGGTISTTANQITVTGIAPSLAWSPLTKDFGNVTIGTNSSTQTFTLTNSGTATATGCSAPSITDTTNFTITTDNCLTNTLAGANATCTVVVRGNPTTIGAKTATLSRTCTFGGTASTTANQIVVTGVDVAPTRITYLLADYAFVLNTVSQTDTPTTDGLNVTYSIAPALPAGLSLNTSTGKISGTPTASTYNIAYTVTATNTGGSYSEVITVTTLSGFNVDTFTDGSDDSVGNGICFSTAAGGCSIRAAIQEANASAATQNLISLSTGTYTTTSALPTLTDSTVIRGQGRNTTIIQPSVNYNFRAFYANTVAFDLENLSITKMGDTLEGGAVRIASSPNALIKNVTFEDNKVTTAVWNPGGAAVSVTNSTALIDQTHFKNNSCDCNGGGLYLGTNGTYTIKNSLFTGNTGKYGGALIANSGPVVTLKNTTIYGNHATAEGTFAVDAATVTYKNVTMVGNDNISGNSGGTAGAFMYAATSNTTFSNSIIHGNINTASGQEQNCKRRYDVGTSSRLGTFTSLGGNFMGDSIGDGAWGVTFNNECLTFFSQSTDRTATDPLVVAGAPTANGGPTDTIKLQATSAAIDGGEDSQCESLDQRGKARPSGNHCDSGALEMQGTD